MLYTEEQLTLLREKTSKRMSAKRFSHTLGVERCAKRLGELILPNRVSELRAAALLHDIAKEMPIEQQFEVLNKNSFYLTDEDRETTGVIHSYTAPFVIKDEFSVFATRDILSAVFNHTLGCENMSLFDKIIFVSDYVEDTRIYASCIRVREFLFNGIESLSYEEKLKRFDCAFIAVIDGVIEALTRMGQPINSKIFVTKSSL